MCYHIFQTFLNMKEILTEETYEYIVITVLLQRHPPHHPHSPTTRTPPPPVPLYPTSNDICAATNEVAGYITRHNLSNRIQIYIFIYVFISKYI